MIAAEHVVVGSGAGGALTAALLAEAGRDVTVLEEGRDVDASGITPFSLEEMASQYRHGGLSAALGRPPVAYAEGHCLGGSTEINAGLYHLASEETLSRWRSGWAVADLTRGDLEPYAAEVRDTLSVQPLPYEAPLASRKLAEGAAAVGWPALEVPRWYRYDTGVPVRQSMTRTYLPRAGAAGARLLPETRVERLEFQHGRVREVVTSRGRIAAEHVWVCAGAVGTAALLQRSGVRARVGKTLKMHPTVKLVARFPELLESEEIAVHQVKPSGLRYWFGGSASRPGYVALALADDWASNRSEAEAWQHMAVYYAAVRPEGRGIVRALPRLRDPLVTFALTRTDMQALAEGLASLAKMMLAAGATAVYPSLTGGGIVRTTEDADAIASRVRRTTTSVMTVHMFSTVPMGEDEARCPVDSFGRLRGVANVHVNDASLLPDAPGVNPQGTVMAIAARNVAAYLA